MRYYPALELTWRQVPDDGHLDILLAAIDDDQPIAVEERDDAVRVFFATADARSRARARLIEADAALVCTPIDVSDEDWAARSQAGLSAVCVGRILVAPSPGAADDTPDVTTIVIPPSMGFGTGHHASTRLCLRLLQGLPLAGRRVLDVGTGSGVLGIAAAKLGADRVTAVDVDPDALQAARDNIALNGVERLVTPTLADLTSIAGRPYDVILANLTGALLSREAAALSALASRGGYLIASGFQPHEAGDVTASFARAGLRLEHREDEQDWVGAIYVTSPTGSTAS